MAQSKPRVADKIAEWLHEKKIDAAFGIIGGGNYQLFDALQSYGKIKIVCMHHEQAAAMASSYYNRVRGTLASAVLVTTGAGSTNAITGVMAAWMDSIPLLVLSGNEADKYMRKPTRVWGVQGYGSMEMVKKCTKLAVRPEIREIKSALGFAYEFALKDRQGPCWVDICKDSQSAII